MKREVRQVPADTAVDSPSQAESTPVEALQPNPFSLRDHPGRLIRRPEFGAVATTVIMFVFFAIVAHSEGFISLNATSSWANVAAELGIVAVPIGMLVICGEFDLSIGAVLGASSILVSIDVTVYGWPVWVAIIEVLLFGVLVGLFNSLVLIFTKMPSFVVTLASWFIVQGGALGLSRTIAGSSAVNLAVPHWMKEVFASSWHQFHVSILWFAAIAIVGGWVLSSTPFGNWIYATGGDGPAARSAGVPTNRVRICLYLATSCSAALLGILQAAEYNGGDLSNGQSFVFNTLIAAVVGGALLQGGYGSVIGITAGTLTYGIVSTGVYFTGWDSDYAQLILGILLAVAVLANNYFRKIALAGRRQKIGADQ